MIKGTVTSFCELHGLKSSGAEDGNSKPEAKKRGNQVAQNTKGREAENKRPFLRLHDEGGADDQGRDEKAERDAIA